MNDQACTINTATVIDGHLLRLLVGLVALLLPYVVWALNGAGLQSISEAYFSLNPTARDVFVGGLVSVAGFLLAYRHDASWRQWVLAKMAAVSALGVAWVPCQCERSSEGSPWHYVFAGILFLILVDYCRLFYRSARLQLEQPEPCGPPDPHLGVRCLIYRGCAAGMLLAMAAMGLNAIPALQLDSSMVIFWGETAALGFFAISWLTASHVLPRLSPPHKRRWLRELWPGA